ncbi:MAG TPA: hypothetical protein DCY12_08925 [Candidatus Atribacteria bacterium]|nr:hypothetical protein [Candidatus Atribacteria bacterium]
MKTCLVSLVSDQTIPNILVAAHFKADYLLFISTAKMEKKNKTQTILATLALRHLDYSARHNKLEVSEDSIIDFQNKVSQWLSRTQEEYQFIVNLTGGNKLMSLAVYDFFKELGSDMVYVPIPENRYLSPFPKLRPKPSGLLEDRLTVVEYLTACSLKIPRISDLETVKENAFHRKDLTQFLFSHYREVKSLLRWFCDKLRSVKENQIKRGYDFSESFAVENKYQKKLIDGLGFQYDGSQLSKKMYKSEWHYLRGGWLEERLFLAIRDSLPQSADVQIGVEFEDISGNKNEVDVLFTHENILHLVECKSLDSPEGSEDRIGVNDFLYKLGVLRQNFGLTPKAFFASTSENLYKEGNVKRSLTERAKQQGSEIIPLLQTPDLEEYFRKRFAGNK